LVVWGDADLGSVQWMDGSSQEAEDSYS